MHLCMTSVFYSNRNDTIRVGSIVLSSQILGSTSFANDEHPIQLNFQVTWYS